MEFSRDIIMVDYPVHSNKVLPSLPHFAMLGNLENSLCLYLQL